MLYVWFNMLCLIICSKNHYIFMLLCSVSDYELCFWLYALFLILCKFVLYMSSIWLHVCFMITYSVYAYKFFVQFHVLRPITWSVYDYICVSDCIFWLNGFFCLIIWCLSDYIFHVWLKFVWLITFYVYNSMISIWLHNLG